MLDSKEREFYQSTIASLLYYNGMLITKLFTQGQQIPIPTMPMPSFGIEVGLDDMKKLSNSWKDIPSISPDAMGEMFKKFGFGFPSKKDLDDDKAQELK